jgi:hypothetical protein
MRLYLDHEDYGNACFFIVLPEFCFPCCSAVAGVHVSSLYLDISLCSRPGHVLFLVFLSDHFLDLGFWISSGRHLRRSLFVPTIFLSWRRSRTGTLSFHLSAFDLWMNLSESSRIEYFCELIRHKLIWVILEYSIILEIFLLPLGRGICMRGEVFCRNDLCQLPI